MAYLIVLKGHNARESVLLQKDRTILGRNANCDIILPANDFAVSREHACILRIQNKFYIEDLRSRNGTYVNNLPVTTRVQLKDNDRIRICDSLYSFHETLPEPKPELPASLRPEQTLEEPDEPPSIEGAVSHISHLVLESQPAEKLRALVDISNNLSRTLELEPLLPKIVDSLFQLFKQADRAFIILREEGVERDKPFERLIPKVVKTRRGPDESSANYSRSIVKECLKTLQAVRSDDATSDKRFNMAQSIADFRIRSVMCAPLCSQDDKAFGVIQLDTQDRAKKFNQEDLNLLMAVARLASVALDNARLHQESLAQERVRRDLELAHQVQLSFLPRQLPEVAGYESYAQYEPAQEVGGDYYGFIPLSGPQSRLGILVGDVAGKGVSAALLMAKLSSDARFCLLSEADPAKAIMALNDLLCPFTSQMDRFVTLVAAVLDPAAHSVTLVNAGHPPPLIYRRASGQLEIAVAKDLVGLPLGIAEGFPYQAYLFQLEPGDCVVMFTDGVTEAMDKQNNLIEQKAISAALKDGPLPPQTLGERIVKNVKQYAAGRSQHDDITLVCFGRTSGEW
jgi:serine phosphatase RsbU (regulator of sigma subunit)